MKGIILFIFLSTMNIAFAQNYHCSQWKEQSGVSCIFAGERASVWVRQCENPCRWNNYGPTCDIERLCLDENPGKLQSTCSPWKKERGVTCHNPSTGDWEQKWSRGCQSGLATSWCSDENPDDL